MDGDDMLVLEDDPYRKIRFAGETVPPLQALDGDGRVIGLGTFAKLVAPGLRLAYSYASPSEIVEGVRRLGIALTRMTASGSTEPVR
jgi:2-aminoadipate transaminase